MISFVLGFFAIIISLLWITKKPKNFPPGPCIPIIGSIPLLNFDNFQFQMEQMKQKYGPVMGVKFGFENVVLVTGMKEVEEVLKRDEFHGRPNNFLLDSGVIFVDGELWANQRRFAVRHLKDFGFGKNSIEDTLLKEVEEFFQHVLYNKDKVQVSTLFNFSSANVLWTMMGGSRFPYDDLELSNVLSVIQERFRYMTMQGAFSSRHPILSKFLPFLKSVKVETRMQTFLTKFFKKAFKEHRQTMQDEARDFIDVYLKELDTNHHLHPSFSEETLIDVCKDFFVAGAESSGNTLGFALLYCVLYPKWQEMLHEEVISVVGRDKRPSLDDRKNLHKVEAFLSEVFRANTIASFAAPHKALKDTTLNGYDIPKDTMIIVSLWSLLHDKEYWGDPESFRPERFLNEEGLFKKDKKLLNFGAGKRMCPGESLARNLIFIFFTAMIQQFEFGLPEGHPKPSTISLTGLTQAPRPFEVTLKRRPN